MVDMASVDCSLVDDVSFSLVDFDVSAVGGPSISFVACSSSPSKAPNRASRSSAMVVVEDGLFALW